MAAGEAVGIGDAVAAQAFAQVFGFADVEDGVEGVAHEIDAGAVGEVAEKVAAEAFDERARVGEE